MKEKTCKCCGSEKATIKDHCKLCYETLKEINQTPCEFCGDKNCYGACQIDNYNESDIIRRSGW